MACRGQITLPAPEKSWELKARETDAAGIALRAIATPSSVFLPSGSS